MTLAVVAAAVGLAVFASRLASPSAVFGVGIVFSYVLLIDYALLHEAVHENLSSRPWLNRALGTLAGCLFPVPFSLIRVTHQGHHLRNRTDHEMFDLYYPTDNRLLKWGQWYSILCGLFWPLVPLGAILFALCPAVLRTRVFAQAKSAGRLLGDVGRREVRAIRGELLAIVGFFALLVWVCGGRFGHLLVLYACFAFNWSTRQYVGHAFSKRDVVEGAWNLRCSRLTSWLLLHGEYDLNHHRRPDVSWLYLPRLSPPDEERPSYLRQYFRQWLGPRPNVEAAPESLRDLQLTVER
ncbi:MAG TPA: fatty acid desaturase [Thermoanaerobaculia bacterium]